MTFYLHWHCDEPGRDLVQRLMVPLGIQCSALAAAIELGWDEREDITYFDSDGTPLGGVVFKRNFD